MPPSCSTVDQLAGSIGRKNLHPIIAAHASSTAEKGSGLKPGIRNRPIVRQGQPGEFVDPFGPLPEPSQEEMAAMSEEELEDLRQAARQQQWEEAWANDYETVSSGARRRWPGAGGPCVGL